jgi:DNA modification methylase
MAVRIITADCREALKDLATGSIHCCVTSPPFFGLRDYGCDGQIGLGESPEAYVEKIVGVFREVHRALRDDATLWLNLGDSYASTMGQAMRGGPPSMSSTLEGNGHRGGGPKLANLSRVGKSGNRGNVASDHSRRAFARGLKPKDLIGIPWRVAFALQADGWWLRQDIIWGKPNPMPESVTDRCTKAHEYLFLLSKSERYYFDAEAIAEPLAAASIVRLAQDVDNQAGSDRVPGKTNGTMKAVGGWRSARDNFKREQSKRAQPIPGQTVGTHRPDRSDSEYSLATRNKRSVWTIATQPFKEAHFATFPPQLIEPCILAGSPIGGTILDPFGGAGTTGLVADRLQRDAILIELNPAYAAMARKRINADAPLLAAPTHP